MRAADAARAAGLPDEFHLQLLAGPLGQWVSRLNDAVANEDIEAAREYRVKLWRVVLRHIAARAHPDPQSLALWAYAMDSVVGELKKTLRARGEAV